MSEEMEIRLNGEPRRIAAGCSLSDLIRSLGLEPERLAIEVNLEIVRKPDWPKRRISPGDTIEIVHFVGGG